MRGRGVGDDSSRFEKLYDDDEIYIYFSLKYNAKCDSVSVTTISFLVSLNSMFALFILPLESYM